MNGAQWIFADASAVGTVRFAVASPEGTLRNVRAMPSDDHATFTDALLHYARDAGIALRHAECVVAVAGIATGEAIPIMRSRWTIARAGLAAVLDRPATILNDVAATAWSLTSGARVESLDHGVLPDFRRPGRWALVLLDDGVGAAALDIGNDGQLTVIDAEAGHAGFSPRTEAEFALMQKLRGGKAHVSWEAVLTHASDRRNETWAALAGAFAGDVLLSLGAWSGVIVTGRHASDLRDPSRHAAFSSAMQAKSCYARNLALAARGLLPVRDPLAGCLAVLRARDRAMPAGTTRRAA